MVTSSSRASVSCTPVTVKVRAVLKMPFDDVTVTAPVSLLVAVTIATPVGLVDILTLKEPVPPSVIETVALSTSMPPRCVLLPSDVVSRTVTEKVEVEL